MLFTLKLFVLAVTLLTIPFCALTVWLTNGTIQPQIAIDSIPESAAVRCTLLDNLAMACKYDMWCTNGTGDYVVVGENFSRPFKAYWNDGNVWRRPYQNWIRSVQTKNGQNEQSRPYLYRRSVTPVEDDSIWDTRQSTLPPESLIVSDDWPVTHPYFSLVTLGPVWQYVHTRVRDAITAVSHRALWVMTSRMDGFKTLLVNATLAEGREYGWFEESLAPRMPHEMVCGRGVTVIGPSYTPITSWITRQHLVDRVLPTDQRPQQDESLSRIVLTLIDRLDSKHRRFVNPQLAMDQWASIPGVDEVNYIGSLSNISITEQVKVFTNSSIIVMGHGAAAAMSVFMPTNSMLIHVDQTLMNPRAFRELYAGSGGIYVNVEADNAWNSTLDWADSKSRQQLMDCLKSSASWFRSHTSSGNQDECYQAFWRSPILLPVERIGREIENHLPELHLTKK